MHTYAVIDEKSKTLALRVNRMQAVECLQHFRAKGIRCALVLETTTSAGSTERLCFGYSEAPDVPNR